MPRRPSSKAREVEEPAGNAGPGAQGRNRRRYTPEERRAAIEALGKSGLTHRAFAAHYGISVTTLQGWLYAYREGGPKGLERISKGPPSPRGAKALAPAKRAAIEETKRRFPTFGLRKVRDFLARFCGLRVSTGSVAKTLDAAGLRAEPVRVRRRAAPPRRFERSRPGELWQSDITYLHVPWSRRPLYLVAFLDDFSRYVVSFGLHLQQRGEIAIEALLLAISRFGRPQEVLTDQGRQYFAWRGKTDFQRLLEKEGIAHVVARAHHPQTVGKCERFWETIKLELWDRVRAKDLDDARARLDHFVRHYNHFRPHQALSGMTPADRFFGAESAVRGAIEAAMDRNELLLALGETPRKPLFLVGQIGDQTLSLHGERGRVIVETEEGLRRAMDLEDLGAPMGRKEANDERGKHAQRGERTDGAAATSEAWAQAHEVSGAREDAASDPGALGERERGGAGQGAQGGGGDPVRVAGEVDAGRGGGQPLDAPASILAAVAAGRGGDGGGLPQAAAGEEGEAARDDGGREHSRAEEGDRDADAGAVGSEESDRDPSGAARQPRGAGDAGGEPRCAIEPRRDGSGRTS